MDLGLGLGLSSGGVLGGFTNTHSVLLDGSDEYINIDAVQTATASDTVGTIAMWVKPVDGTPAATDYVLSSADTDGNTLFTIISIRTDGKVGSNFYLSGTQQWRIDTDAAAVATGVWTHLAVVQNGTKPVIYVDGVAVAQSEISGNPDKTLWFAGLTGGDNMRLGDYSYNSGGETGHFNGNIDEPHFFNTNLTAGEITELYNLGVPYDVRTHSKSANLVSGFHIDGDTVSTMTDYVGSNNGTYVNVEQADLELDTP